jgi:hypothetical protein
MNRLLEALSRLSVKGIEASLIDLIAAVTPWLAPLIPAYLVYHNMAERLNYSQPFALIGAAAVEFLGLSAVHTAVTFWKWNDNRKTGRAPTLAAIGAGAFYVVIVLTVNAALDIWRDNEYVKIFAHGLLSLLSVDAALIIAMRSSHARMVRDDVDERERRRIERIEAKKHELEARQAELKAKEDANQRERDANETRTMTREKFVTLWQSNGHKSISALAKEMGVNPRTAQKWVAYGTAYRDDVDDPKSD